MKIVALDLDGVLVAYPEAWVAFINSNSDDYYADLNDAKNRIPFNRYKELKLKYRTSGIKATLPMNDGAAELTKELRKQGYTIIILTARPIYEVKEVFRDTLYWLKTNKIEHDLLFAGGHDKQHKIAKYFPEIEFIVEDNATIANNIAKTGKKVFLLDNIYNQQDIITGVKRIKKLNEVIKNGSKN